MIQIQLFAAFADFIGARELQFEYLPGMTCSDIWQRLSEQYPRVQNIPVLFAVGEEYVRPDTELKDGDSLMLFPPVSGGDASYIYDTPLSVERALEGIRHEDGGGEALFIGRVRRRNEGKIVRHLFYECQISMAEKQIDRIVGEMQARWPLKRVHIEHRIGRLEIGDIAVIVAVSAEHRKEAIEACRYGIDELKHRAPIWKKEVSETGEEWIGACDHE